MGDVVEVEDGASENANREEKNPTWRKWKLEVSKHNGRFWTSERTCEENEILEVSRMKPLKTRKLSNKWKKTVERR